MKEKSIKEPIRKKWIWVFMVLLVMVVVPWYFPSAAVEPFILGFPLWAFISLIFSIALCGYLSWLCRTQWNLVEDEEESERMKEER